MQWLGLQRLPLLDRLAAHPARRARARSTQRGLDFYDRLVDALLDARHRAVRHALPLGPAAARSQDAGGWPARDTVDAFVDYADVVTRRLGDRVRHVDHAQRAVVHQHRSATARARTRPGERDWPRGAGRARITCCSSHGCAVEAIRAERARRARSASRSTSSPTEPASPSDADRDAARAFDGSFNRWFLDPLYGRGYPRDVIADHVAPATCRDELDLRRTTAISRRSRRRTDFLGINYYSRAVMRSTTVPEARQPAAVGHRLRREDRHGLGGRARWPARDPAPRPRRLRAAAHLHHRERRRATAPRPTRAAACATSSRQRYLWTHFAAAHEAIAEGIAARRLLRVVAARQLRVGARATRKRFGMFWVDYATQTRLAKDSAHLCRRIIRDNAITELEHDLRRVNA